MRTLLLPFLMLLIIIPAQPQSWTVSVNNKPFKGARSGGPERLLLEAAPLASMTSVDLQVDAATGQVTLKGEVIPTTVENDKVMVDAKDLATRVGGKYTVNKDMQSVDIYLLAGKPLPASGAAAPAETGAMKVSCLELCTNPKKYDGKSVAVTGEILINENATEAQLKAGNPGGYVRQVIERHPTTSYYNVWVATGSRIEVKAGRTVTVYGIFRYPDVNQPTIQARRIQPH